MGSTALRTLLKEVTFTAQPGLFAECDPAFIRVVLENLLGNAWKFTSKNPTATITFQQTKVAGRPAFIVRDDGAGFDMAFAGKMFGAVPEVALGSRVHRNGDRPGDRSARCPTARRRKLGRGGGRPRGRFVFHSPRPGGSPPMNQKIILLVCDALKWFRSS